MLSYIQKLEESNPLRESIIRSAVQTLQLPLGSKGLDAGCGIGYQALLPADEVGLEDLTVHTFVKDVHAPLRENIQTALISLFFMLWGERQPEVSEEDWEEFQRLCQPDSPDCLLNLQDYYAFFTYSMFSGKVPK